MKLLFSILRPQIVFGAGGGGGGSVKRGPKGSGNGPTGFADQASRMAKSQRQLGAPQLPGFDLEAGKDVPSVAKRAPQRDSSPIDAASGGFNNGFNKSPKPNKQNGYKFKNIGSRINPITGQKEVQSVIIDPNGNMKKTDYADKFRDSDNRNIGMHQGLAASTGKPRNIKTSSGKLGILPDGSSIKGGIEFDGQGNTYSSSTGNGLDLSGIRGVAEVKTPSFGDQGTSKPVELPRSPEPSNGGRPTPPQPGVIFDDFIPRNSDGSPKYTAPDGSPLRYPYDPSTPARPTPPPGGGKGGGTVALPPKRPPVRAPQPFPGMDVITPMPSPDLDPVRPDRPMTPDRPRGPVPSPIFDDFIPRNSDGSPKYTAPDGSPLRYPYDPSTPARPTMPTPRQPMPQPVLYGGGKGGAGPRPSRPSVPVPPQRPMPVGRPVYQPRVSTPVQSPVPYGGKGGGARPSTQQRRPQMPFTYYRPKR